LDKEKSLELAKGLMFLLSFWPTDKHGAGRRCFEKVPLGYIGQHGHYACCGCLGVPLIALHGPTNPKRWGPLSDAAVVLGQGRKRAALFSTLVLNIPQTRPFAWA
jgi:hypothetical protein